LDLPPIQAIELREVTYDLDPSRDDPREPVATDVLYRFEATQDD